MKAFLQLIRIRNLAIIALTQYLMRWCIIHPMLKNIRVVQGGEVIQLQEFHLQFSEFHFALLVLATLLLTAAGYVINDYFDTKTDLLNHPGTVVVGNAIPRRVAMALHILFNFVGVILGFYVAFLVKIPSLGFIFIMVAGLLWFYSTTYKRQFLVGNIIVSLLTGLVPLMVILFEIPLLNRAYGEILIRENTSFGHIIAWVGGFSFFAFLTTLTREIIKDMEDFEGDAAYGRRSLPIVIGMKGAKVTVSTLIGLTIIALVIIYLKYLVDLVTLIYLLTVFILPCIYLIYKIFKAKTKADYHIASIQSKMIMLAGILYAVVVYFIVTFKY